MRGLSGYVRIVAHAAALGAACGVGLAVMTVPRLARAISAPARTDRGHGTGAASRGEGAASVLPAPLRRLGPAEPSAHSAGLTSTVDAETGWVTGWVFTHNPDNDRVSYTGTGPTGKGAVIVYEDGSFLYKPTVEARRLAAAMGGDQDTFAMRIRDGSGNVRSISVTVDVLPWA
jgi:hypothetical protein